MNRPGVATRRNHNKIGEFDKPGWQRLTEGVKAIPGRQRPTRGVSWAFSGEPETVEQRGPEEPGRGGGWAAVGLERREKARFLRLIHTSSCPEIFWPERPF